MMADKIPLLLIPGLLCDHRLWTHQLAALADLASIQVADHTQHDAMFEIARSILDQAPPRFALAGLSMGGYLAFEIIRQAPDRVLKLALINTSARPDSPERIQKRLDFMALATRGRFRGVSAALLPFLVHHSRLGNKELTQTVLAMSKEMGAEIFLRQERAIMDRLDSRSGLAAIHCPTLVIGGRQDEMTPANLQEEIAAGIDGSRLLILENCGHLAPLECPLEVSQALRAWLKEDDIKNRQPPHPSTRVPDVALRGR